MLEKGTKMYNEIVLSPPLKYYEWKRKKMRNTIMNVRKALPILIFSLLPNLSFAGGIHSSHEEAKELVPKNTADINRTISVKMSDNMRFSPSQIEVKKGETVQFSLKNVGQLQHEFVIGEAQELKEHAQMMREMPNMQHQEANMLSLKGGQSGTLVWKFKQTGSITFACLKPGHWEAGMEGKFEVK